MPADRTTLLGLALVLALAPAAAAQTSVPTTMPPPLGRYGPRPEPASLPGTQPPLFPRTVAALRDCPQTVPVPPTLEIEVLDPGVDPRGNPAVLTRPTTVCTPTGPEGRLAVDIPPTVLVHRYYYTGNRTFQGPMIPGGPTIVVANHPRTMERLYVPVQMLPGAPRVTYTEHAIEYDYGSQAITITFCWLTHRPKVDYRQGVPFTKRMEDALSHTAEATRALVNRTDIPEVRVRLTEGIRNVAETTADRMNALGERLVAPPVALFRMTPLSNLFTTPEEDRAIRARDTEVQRAGRETQRQNASFPDNR
jgi:hypothetical protein